MIAFWEHGLLLSKAIAMRPSIWLGQQSTDMIPSHEQIVDMREKVVPDERWNIKGN